MHTKFVHRRYASVRYYCIYGHWCVCTKIHCKTLNCSLGGWTLSILFLLPFGTFPQFRLVSLQISSSSFSVHRRHVRRRTLSPNSIRSKSSTPQTFFRSLQRARRLMKMALAIKKSIRFDPSRNRMWLRDVAHRPLVASAPDVLCPSRSLKESRGRQKGNCASGNGTYRGKTVFHWIPRDSAELLTLQALL